MSDPDTHPGKSQRAASPKRKADMTPALAMRTAKGTRIARMAKNPAARTVRTSGSGPCFPVAVKLLKDFVEILGGP